MKKDLFSGEVWNIEDLQQALDQMMEEHNHRDIPQFEDYSPAEMFNILQHSFHDNSVVSLRVLPEEEYAKSPIYMIIKSLIDIINREGKIKLTANGYLPPRFVKELYNHGFQRNELIETGRIKLNKETDSDIISLARLILEGSSVCTKRKGVLAISRKGQKLIRSGHDLFRELFLTYVNRFNWSSQDEYICEETGQLGVGFSLILLAKYGELKRIDTFYAEKYLKAFPRLMEGYTEPGIGTLESYFMHCYSLRTLDRFANYWGLITLEQESFLSPSFVTKTGLFDKLIECRPPERKQR